MTDKFSPIDYDIFCGMDVDKRKTFASFLDWQGSMKEIGLPNKGAAVLSYARKKYPGKRVAFVYEAGPTGFTLYDEISSAGEKCLVAAPSMVPTAPGQRVKTNRLDGRKLAINLRGGQIKGIRVPSVLYRDLRHLCQWRDSCVKEIGRNQRRIKSLLLCEGISFPGQRWNSETKEALRKLDCREAIQFKLIALLEAIQEWQEKLKAHNCYLKKFIKNQPELEQNIAYLISVGFIGWTTAVHFLARVGDWRQLEKSAQTCGFLGLGPSEHSTGEKIKKGPITGIGDRRLRSKLIQGSWRAVQKDKELKAYFIRIARSESSVIGPKKAIVAVTRKRVARMHAVLKDQRFYFKENNPKQLEADFPGQTRSRPRAKEPFMVSPGSSS